MVGEQDEKPDRRGTVKQYPVDCEQLRVLLAGEVWCAGDGRTIERGIAAEGELAIDWRREGLAGVVERESLHGCWEAVFDVSANELRKPMTTITDSLDRRATDSTSERNPMNATTNSVHVRWMIRRDIDRVLDIESRTFERHAWDEQDFVDELRGKSTIGRVAEINEQIVGYSVYRLDLRKIVVRNLAVDVDWRRQELELD